MKKAILATIVIVLLIQLPAFALESLRDVYLNAQPGNGYLKYIELDPNVEYEGNLVISGSDTVRIIGNGAKIFVPVYSYAISVNRSKLDISGCVFINGVSALVYQSSSSGEICNNSFYNFSHSAMKIDHPHPTENVQIYDNIISNCQYGIWALEGYLPGYIAYNIVYNSGAFHYAQLCSS